MKKRFLKSKASLMSLILIISIFTIYLANPVSAENNVCCEKTTDGDYCVYTSPDDCDNTVRNNNMPSSCEKTDYCRIGCCFDDTGDCYRSVGKAECTGEGGTWYQDEKCNINECKLGCCVLSGECQYVTDKKCGYITEEYNELQKDFREVNSEQECLSLCSSGNYGCCVSENSCFYDTQEECDFDFYENKICSTLSECERCKAKDHKDCYEGDIYWFDSCNNREDLAESCDYNSGFKCGKVEGNVVCKDLACYTTYSDETANNPSDPARNDTRLGGRRENGESWCIYESGTGDYKDRPGTRQYRHMCIEGEEMTESCRDFREEVCVQSIGDFVESQCLYNDVYDAEVTQAISTVPIGNEFWEGKGVGECSNADMTITTVWKKCKKGGWKCVGNCQYKTQQWVDEWAKMCKSQGDCGADANVLGKVTYGGLLIYGPGTGVPTKPSSGAIAEWMKYGVYGGMRYLSENFEEVADPNIERDPQTPGAKAMQTVGTVAGAVGAVAGVASMAITSGLLGATTTSAGVITTVGVIAAVLAVVAIVLIVIAIIAIIITLILGKCKYDDRPIAFTCLPWQAPYGGEDCEKCNDNPATCTEYKCKSLGMLCGIVNEGTKEQKCANLNPGDVNSPVISPWIETITKPYTIKESNDGYEIQQEVKAFTPITIGIKTDELSQCRISLEHKNSYEAMPIYFGDSYFKDKHNLTLNPVNNRTYEYYIRCIDPSGNTNDKDYVIKLKTERGPDLTPPIILENGYGTKSGEIVYLPNELNQTILNLKINEPSNCKWDVKDEDYLFMQNEFLCSDEPNEEAIYYAGFGCITFMNISLGENKFYMRCSDLSNNTNMQSYIVNMKRTDPLTISKVEPNGVLYSTNSPRLEVYTNNGAQSGRAICGFDDNEDTSYENMIAFYETDSSASKQQLNNLSLGAYKYYVKCRDIASNEANAIIQFQVDVDTSASNIVSIYNSDKTITVELNEEATCTWSTKTSNENLGLSKKFSFTIDDSYCNFNCVDIYNNQMKVRIYV